MNKVFLLGANKSIDTSEQVVVVNQVVQMEGYNNPKYVVYDITRDSYGSISYKLINLNNYCFDCTEIIRPLSERFGIGIYYDEINPQFKTDKEVAELLEKARAIEKEKAEKEKAEKEKKERIRIEEVKAIGRKRFAEILPDNAQAIIIGRLKQDESDSQTDYFASSTLRTIILGFFTHKRDIFSEMRKHASNFEETAYLAEYNADYEHREKYSMGAGYYLGESKYRGWIIEKCPIYKRENTIEQFAYTAGDLDNDNIHLATNQTTKHVNIEQVKIDNLSFEIVDYSEKAIVLFGDTKEIKDQLKEIGGRFNSRLTYNDKKKAGWVFQKSKKEELQNIINLGCK